MLPFVQILELKQVGQLKYSGNKFGKKNKSAGQKRRTTHN